MTRRKVALGIILFLGIFISLWWISGTSAVDPNNKNPKIFVVERGQGVRAIAKNLKDLNLIKDPVAFFLLTKTLGIDNKIEAGSFRLLPSMNAEQIAKELTHGTLDIWVTIPEGQRATEIADTLRKTMPNYDSSWDQKLVDNEGYLFPETYLFAVDSDIDAIIQKMRNDTFDVKYQNLKVTKKGFTQNEIVTVASLIEREAKHPEDRPVVASVIYNRLKIGMALQIDATVQYAKGQIKGNWWPKVTQDDYKGVKSSYNTYLNPGLPPTPISNPGLASLEAAANPANTNYLYYITDRSGVNRYAETLAGHNANIQKYGL